MRLAICSELGQGGWSSALRGSSLHHLLGFLQDSAYPAVQDAAARCIQAIMNSYKPMEYQANLLADRGTVLEVAVQVIESQARIY